MRIDTVFENATFHTQDTTRPLATRVGVLHGRVVAVDDELDGTTAKRRIDLGGTFVVPGLHDSHLHLTHLGQRSRMVDVSATAAPTLDDVYGRIGRAARTAERGSWIFAGGYDQNRIGAHPTAAGLDAVSPLHPVWVERCSGHMGVANTRVFEMLGYPDRRRLPDPAHGVVERDADGRATGLLQNAAQSYVARAVGPPDPSTREADIRRGARTAVALGLTTITEPGIGGDSSVVGVGNADLRAFQALRDRGALDVRCTLMPAFESLDVVDGEVGVGLPHGIRSGFGDEYLRIGATKAYADGSLVGQTAALHTAYANDPCSHGLLAADPDHFAERFAAVHAAGWQIAVHAIGDRGIDLALDAIEMAQRAAPRTDPRHRIEHFVVATDAQIARTKRLGAVPVPQGNFIRDFGDGYLRALGHDRGHGTLRMRSLLEAGIDVPGGSDAPITTGDPLEGLQALVDRRTRSGMVLGGHEAISASQALRCYTIGSAYADRREHELGRISRGYLADMTVLSDSPFANPDAFARVQVRATIVNGSVVHDGS